MAEWWQSFIEQIPFVVVFVWYSLEMNKRSDATQQVFLEALQRRDEAFDKRNQAVIEAITSMNAVIAEELRCIREAQISHDVRTRRRSASKETEAKS